MRIFISSARKGLEEERDALDGLVRALGHTPVRFEDFSAQTTPSREACLKALSTADACLFLLGPNYGHVFPETGQSATHDEWVAAQQAGMPRLVYRKLDVTFESSQHEFVRVVEAYATGVFRDSFRTAADLLPKVAGKIRELESGPSPLAFAKLAQPPALHWTLEEGTGGLQTAGVTTLLELHVLPLDSAGYSARELEALGHSLPGRVRLTGMVEDDVPLSSSRSQDHMAVSVPASRPRSWDTPRPGQLVEVRLYKTGQLSTRALLPQDSMGPILDPNALPKQIAELLNFTGSLNIIRQDRIVVAAGVSEPAMTSIDTFDPRQSRRTASLAGFGRSFALRTEPDESVTLAALQAGADEVAEHLARALIAHHPSAA
ncbi:DUF4062 domain-containing protein [Streptomyces sp. Cmuel-A718b]|uniref:DUF4062 domain-containing protein n=1 Tax=Streptomyces sp. Cmuel-A718b TaxID=697328 RepID=UPI00081F5354|nr:DUF4062 domain-containing protein [Streptomyces sp. Cmuel-A718b]SCF81967.1 protein of unknown function [Streptomyces sp. Cmuel-A718b]